MNEKAVNTGFRHIKRDMSPEELYAVIVDDVNTIYVDRSI